MRTLVIEDAGSIRRLLETLLEERGHEVVGAENAEDALALHTKSPAELVLVDLVLPGMSGGELVRKIRKLPNGDLPVVVAFTGRPDDAALEDLLDAGIDDYLTKPLVPEELRRRLTIAEAHVRKARRRLHAESAHELSEAGLRQLAVGVAHELNNPLASVVSNLGMLDEELTRLADSLPPDRRELVGEMVAESTESATRMRDIVRDLQTFSRSGQPSSRALDLVPIVEASLRMVQNQIRHHARVEKVYERAPRVAADESRLAQVFLNLLLQAAEAVPAGRADEHQITLTVGTDAGGRAVVEISDTGPGMEPQELGRVFEPYRTGRSGGLDLSVCRNLIASMGGQIDVESMPGEGTRFRVVLPPAAEVAEPAAPQRPSVAKGTQRLQILVVDDEALVARSLRRALRDHQVTIASSGQEALDLLATGASFDVVLCDLMMPELTGMDVYERVVAERPELAARFVFMTGGAFTGRARDFLDRVDNERLDKPFDVVKVRELVRDLAAR